MKISKPIKILVGIATLWIVAISALSCLLIVFGGRWPRAFLTGSEGPIFAFNLCTAIGGFALIVFYLIHLFNNPKLGFTWQVDYSIGILFLPFFVMPIYYYACIWLANSPALALKYSPVGILADLAAGRKRSKHE